MIAKLLIANRGEIAVRIARTAHRMGVDTVGVHSESDRDAVHVDAVDLAVLLSGRTPAQSYLRMDPVLAAALEHGCDAVHPGYGFLSENAEFARRVIDAGLIWVGPTPEQIAMLGDKVTAKKVALAAGVPTTPVFDADQVPPDLAMPVLVKAAAGGGGRGMRIVHDRAGLAAAVNAARREAESAFGDGTVFVEPYVERAHHVEVQIFGDRHGNVIHLGDRECSVQRRNQKVIEESPAPCLDARTRTLLHDGALALARHIGYENAGTVEYLVSDLDQSITFLEVNTRLQVEHPVTEAVTGLDLVELQLLVAAGERLPITQPDVEITGHAIEVRVVAERPGAGWLPAVGTLTEWAFGSELRVDSGVRAGSEVSADYDSMLAKVIAHATNRTQAVQLLRRGLRTARVAGVDTNLAAMGAVLAEPDFVAGCTTTDYLDRHPDLLSEEDIGDPATRTALLVAAALHRATGNGGPGPWSFAPPGWRNVRIAGLRQSWQLLGAEEPDAIEYVTTGADRYELLIGAFPEPGPDGTLPADDRARVGARVVGADAPGARRLAVEVDGVRRLVHICEGPDGTIRTATATGRATWTPVTDTSGDAGAAGPSRLTAALPGVVTAVHVTAGQAVAAGQLLVVMEAMKMEHSLIAPKDAVVEEVLVTAGQRVSDGDVLVRLSDDPLQ